MSRGAVGFWWRTRAGANLNAGSRSRRGKQHRLQPAILELEERRLLSGAPPIVVDNPTDTPVAGEIDLRQAIAEANSATSDSTIEFSSLFNTQQTIVLNGSLGGQNGLVLSNTNYSETILGPSVGVWVKGSYVLSDHVNHVFFIDEGVQASISNLTIAEGFDESPITGGGGMRNNGTVTLTGCTFLGNDALFGGGLDNWGSASLTNCRFSNNQVVADNFGQGGAIFNEGVALSYNNPATVTLKDCTISGNSASVEGGGLYNKHLAKLYDCTLTRNYAEISGGGMYNHATTYLNHCNITDNTAGRYGGGLYSSSGTANLENCTFSGNSATDSGGGMQSEIGVANLTNCTFNGNKADKGGGLFNNDFNNNGAGTMSLKDCTISGNTGGGVGNRGTASLTNCTVDNNPGGGLYSVYKLDLDDCTVSGNTASGYGGGLYNLGTATLTNCTFSSDTAGSGYYGGGLYNDGTATLEYCTFSENTATYGGGIYNYHRGTVTLQNTLVAGNTASSGGPDVWATVDSSGYNLIGNADGSDGWDSSDSTGTTLDPLNPRLAPLGNYGGPTQTMALLPGSLAIGGGIGGALYPTDQRGFPRLGSNTDIGAFESSGFTIAVFSGNNQVATVNTGFAAPLVVKVSSIDPIEPVAGGVVGFIAPTSGASCTFPGEEDGTSFVTIAGSGLASIAATANATVGGPYTVTATTFGDPHGNRVDANFSLTNSSGAPYQLVIHTQPSPTATAGAAFSTQPVIYVEDQAGHIETGDNTTRVTVGLKSGTGPLGGTTTVTVSGGVATFTNLYDNRAETISLLFTSAPALLPAVSNNIVVSPAAASQLVIHTQPSPTATAGSPFATQPVIYLEDRYGNLETGDNATRVTAGLHSGTGPLGGTTTVTVSGGTASFTNLADNKAETISLLFTSVPALTSAISSDIVVSAAAASQLVIHTQPSPTATAGSPFPIQPVIYVEDQYGNLETGDNSTQVTVGLNSGTGPLRGEATVKVSGGVASFTGLFDNRAETISLLFTSVPALTQAVSNNIVVSPAAASQLVIHTQPSPAATAGSPFATQPVIYVEDQYGNLETGDNTTQVIVGLDSGTGPLGGATAPITVSGGVASSMGLHDNRAETISLLFTAAPALPQAISNDIVVSPAAASQLVIHTQPSPTATAGSPFATQPVIYVEDQYGNLETGDNATQVIVGLESGTGPLGGATAPITVSGGVANFTNLHDNIAETISLLFTSVPALTQAVSNDIVVSPAAASQLMIHTQPSPTATAGSPFVTQPVIYVEDEYGNLETGDNSTQVTAGVESGTGPLLGTTTVTVSGGVANFSNLHDNIAETISLLFTSVPALTQAISNDIVVSAVAPYALVIHTQPSPTAIAGEAFSTQPVVYVLDEYGNLETGDNSTQVEASLRAPGGGSGPLDGTTTVTVSGGIATFTNLSYHKAEKIVLVFAGSSLVKATSNPVTINPAATSRLSVSAPATAIRRKPFTITVTAYGPNGNVATGFTGTVHFEISGRVAKLPRNYTFRLSDRGVHTFANAVSLISDGPQTITVVDADDPSVNGTARIEVRDAGSRSRVAFSAATVVNPVPSGPKGVLNVPVSGLPHRSHLCSERLFRSTKNHFPVVRRFREFIALPYGRQERHEFRSTKILTRSPSDQHAP